MTIEIERKFLVKSLPKRDPDSIYDIKQYYSKNEWGIWERARTYHSEQKGERYIHTIKKNLSKGVNIEDEKEISQSEYQDFINNCMTKSDSRWIEKFRYEYIDNDLKWEVDVFGFDYKLIIAEVELPTKNFDLKIPKFMEDIILLEVTGMKQFNNRSLSLKLKNFN